MEGLGETLPGGHELCVRIVRGVPAGVIGLDGEPHLELLDVAVNGLISDCSGHRDCSVGPPVPIREARPPAGRPEHSHLVQEFTSRFTLDLIAVVDHVDVQVHGRKSHPDTLG